MPLFGKKKEKSDDVLNEIRKAVDGFDQLQQQISAPEIKAEKTDIDKLLEKKEEVKPKEEIKPREEAKPKEEVREVERPAFAPLFVKIDRYRQILNAIGYLKSSMIMVKNSLMTLRELDKAREETAKLIEDAMGKLEKKITSLDQELIRPSGYNEIVTTPEYQDVETVEATIADLKGQIEQLRSELKSVS